MEWRDRERQGEDEDATGRIDVEAPGYSVLREGARGGVVAGLLRRPLIPVAILAAVVLLVGVWRMGGEPSPTDAEQLSRLESHLAQLEQRLETMKAAAPAAPVAEAVGAEAEGLQRQIDALVRRMDRIETALGQRLAALENRARPAPPAAPAPKAAAPAPAATPTPAKANLYTVKPGDTLYSIGRRENLSVEKLRQLNNLKAGDAIHPGDRLKVSP